MIAGKIMVGHNVRGDWRLLRKRFPDATLAGVVDTLRLARSLHPERKKGHGLRAWIERLGLTDAVSDAAPDSQPHRALWDTIAAALLLDALMTKAGPDNQTADYLRATAGIPSTTPSQPHPQPNIPACGT